MTRNFSHRESFQGPKEKVWERTIDFERWKDWTPTVTKIERIGAADKAVGARYKIWQPGMRPAVWIITDFADGESFTWETASHGFPMIARHTLRSLGNGLHELELMVELQGFLGSLMALLLGKKIRNMLAVEAREAVRDLG